MKYAAVAFIVALLLLAWSLWYLLGKSSRIIETKKVAVRELRSWVGYEVVRIKKLQTLSDEHHRLLVCLQSHGAEKIYGIMFIPTMLQAVIKEPVLSDANHVRMLVQCITAQSESVSGEMLDKVAEAAIRHAEDLSDLRYLEAAMDKFGVADITQHLFYPAFARKKADIVEAYNAQHLANPVPQYAQAEVSGVT